MASRSRILVVDDDRMLRDILAEVLADEGHDVRTASNGHEALARLDGWDADVVILDLMMPLMDGFAFRAAQRQRDRSSEAPVIVLSAGQNLDAAAKRVGAAAWLAKPFRLDQVLATVEALTG